MLSTYTSCAAHFVCFPSSNFGKLGHVFARQEFQLSCSEQDTYNVETNLTLLPSLQPWFLSRGVVLPAMTVPFSRASSTTHRMLAKHGEDSQSSMRTTLTYLKYFNRLFFTFSLAIWQSLGRRRGKRLLCCHLHS